MVETVGPDKVDKYGIVDLNGTSVEPFVGIK